MTETPKTEKTLTELEDNNERLNLEVANAELGNLRTPEKFVRVKLTEESGGNYSDVIIAIDNILRVEACEYAITARFDNRGKIGTVIRSVNIHTKDGMVYNENRSIDRWNELLTNNNPQ